MHYGSSLLTGGQQRGIISPFGAMHAGSSLLARQQRGILCLSVLCTLAHLFWLVSTEVYYAFRCYALWLTSFDRWSAKRYNFAFQCHARWLVSFGSSAQRYIMPFDVMHAGSSLLARQHKGILCLSVLCTLAHPGCINIVWGIPHGLAPGHPSWLGTV
ncbi:hypothetical protein Tco_1421498 [Tanacetum coccineum]